MTRLRIRLGRDAVVVGEDRNGIALESHSRLAPGRGVEILSGGDSGDERRSAVVDFWRVSAIGTAGPTYRGYCKWT